jgi:glycosyltransferase involved in cell wall biosynthesis
LKILESLAAGIPIVSTSAGAEGLNLVHGRDILIADEPRQFAQSVLQLLKDENLRSLLRKNGRDFVENHYDWRVIHSQFETYIAQVIQTRHIVEKA